MRVFLTAVLLLLPLHVVIAEEPLWLMKVLKQDNPNELAYLVGVDTNCPTTEEKAESIVEGVFVRSRVKPLSGVEWVTNDVYLQIRINCIKPKNNNPVFEIDIYFANYQSDIPLIYDKDFGALGIGGAEYVEGWLKDGVESAITAYLKANFDLGD